MYTDKVAPGLLQQEYHARRTDGQTSRDLVVALVRHVGP